MKLKKPDGERETLQAFKQGKLVRAKNAKTLMQAATSAANQYWKKNSRINIRLSEPDLQLLKRKAAEEGLPYQSLVASILHQFVMGRLVRVR